MSYEEHIDWCDVKMKLYGRENEWKSKTRNRNDLFKALEWHFKMNWGNWVNYMRVERCFGFVKCHDVKIVWNLRFNLYKSL